MCQVRRTDPAVRAWEATLLIMGVGLRVVEPAATVGEVAEGGRLTGGQGPRRCGCRCCVRRRMCAPGVLRLLHSHMIAGYARHAGHADLIRERIDGATGV
ncbi:MAG: hypothetical protein JWR70_3430 [Modestobacter sp.]|jgi:hypothetical protein|nr:hypothetical protein [Modestobacter sp.]